VTTSSARAEAADPGFDLIALYRLRREPTRYEFRVEDLRGGKTEVQDLELPLVADEVYETLGRYVDQYGAKRVFFKLDTGPTRDLDPETRRRIFTGELHPRDIYIGG